MSKITPAGPDQRVGVNAVHEELCGWFLGPRAENAGVFKKLVLQSIDKHVERRRDYQPNDPDFIPPSIIDSEPYKGSIAKLENALCYLDGGLSEGTVPFWSGRYNAHMTNDTTMSGMLGYWSTMLSNPNNVAMEASPFTGTVEKYAGLQLANLLGFNIGNDPRRHAEPMSWGHITSDGSVANLEALWAARNLKYYPLSLRNALVAGCFPPTVANTFTVTTCQQKKIKFMDLSTWEMLNLEVETILEIPTRLKAQYNITPHFLTQTLRKYSAQTVGKDTIERQYFIVPPKCTVASTRHYSWPKSAAVLGIGEANMVNIPVDNQARVDMHELERELRKLKDGNQQAVYMVVVVAGSTEEGSVDPLGDVIALRALLQKELGLSFVIHVDAAWGGYFRTMIKPRIMHMPIRDPNVPGYTGILPLRDITKIHLAAIGQADSVTIDPHKAGYIPYPAGALCYRDERMKYLVTWDSPYINTQAGVEEIGSYGIEGSKAGAAAVATALSNYVIGMYDDGYGKLLGEASFACSMFSAYWATMHSENFVVVPFNMLPVESPDHIERYGTSITVQGQQKFITDYIIGKSDLELKHDPVAMELLRNIGSELIINAFACNFFLENNNVWNQDVEESNYLNTCIAQRLRVVPGDMPLINKTQLFITSTIFEEPQYAKCADTFKMRLGLNGAQDLFVLRNVVMSPFVTSAETPDESLLMDLMKVFKKVADEEAMVRRKCNAIDFKDTQEFIMQGIEELHLVYQHLLHKAGHREQIIIAVTIPALEMSKYRAARKASPQEVFFLYCKGKQSITTMLKEMKFKATFQLEDSSAPIEVLVTVNKIVKRRPINHKFLRKRIHMEYVPFYLYGNEKEMHIDHMLIEAPSVQLSADRITLTSSSAGEQAIRDNIENGLIAIVYSSDGNFVPPSNEIHLLPIFDREEHKSVDIYKDPNTEYFDDETLKRMLQQPPLAKGEIMCMANVFTDNISPNQIPVPNPDIQPLKNRGPLKTEELKKDTPVHGMSNDFINMLRVDMGLKPQDTRFFA